MAVLNHIDGVEVSLKQEDSPEITLKELDGRLRKLDRLIGRSEARIKQYEAQLKQEQHMSTKTRSLIRKGLEVFKLLKGNSTRV